MAVVGGQSPARKWQEAMTSIRCAFWRRKPACNRPSAQSWTKASPRQC